MTDKPSREIAFPRLYEAIGRDETVLRHIARTFETEGKQLLLDLRRASSVRDMPRLARLGHTLRGNAVDFEDQPLALQAGELERLAKAGVADASVLGADLEAALQDLLLRIRRFLDEGPK